MNSDSMIADIIKALDSEAGEKIRKAGNFSDEKTGKILSVIGESASSVVKGKMLSGDFSDVMNLFSQKPNTKGANSLQSGISNEIVSSLTRKLGLTGDMSKKIASIALPVLIGLITKQNSKTPDDDPSPLNEIFGSITGKQASTGAAGKLLGKLFKR